MERAQRDELLILLRDVASAQDDVTHLNEKGPGFETQVGVAQQMRGNAMRAVVAWVETHFESKEN